MTQEQSAQEFYDKRHNDLQDRVEKLEKIIVNFLGVDANRPLSERERQFLHQNVTDESGMVKTG